MASLKSTVLCLLLSHVAMSIALLMCESEGQQTCTNAILHSLTGQLTLIRQANCVLDLESMKEETLDAANNASTTPPSSLSGHLRAAFKKSLGKI